MDIVSTVQPGSIGQTGSIGSTEQQTGAVAPTPTTAYLVTIAPNALPLQGQENRTFHGVDGKDTSLQENSSLTTPTRVRATSGTSVVSTASVASTSNDLDNTEQQPASTELSINIAAACDTVIKAKNKDISGRKIPSGIAKVFFTAGIITAAATTLFLTLAQTAPLILVASVIILCTALTALLISTLFSLALKSDTNKDNCQAFIANTLKEMPLIETKEQPDGQSNLQQIIEDYLGGSIPINVAPFIKLRLLNRSDIDTATQDENAKKYVSELLENFVKILEDSKKYGHEEAKNITPEFLQALKADIELYTDTLNADDVRTLANLPSKEPSVEETSDTIECESSF